MSSCFSTAQLCLENWKKLLSFSPGNIQILGMDGRWQRKPKDDLREAGLFQRPHSRQECVGGTEGIPSVLVPEAAPEACTAGAPAPVCSQLSSIHGQDGQRDRTDRGTGQDRTGQEDRTGWTGQQQNLQKTTKWSPLSEKLTNRKARTYFSAPCQRFGVTVKIHSPPNSSSVLVHFGWLARNQGSRGRNTWKNAL